MAELRKLIIVLGDQLDLDAAAFDGFDAAVDAVWMAEVAEESTPVWSSKPRTVMFLAAMRHFALALQGEGRLLHYTRLDAPGNAGCLGLQLAADIERLRPASLVMTAPGDWRVLQRIKGAAEAAGLPLDIREDRHFFVSVRAFAAHAKGRKSLPLTVLYDGACPLCRREIGLYRRLRPKAPVCFSDLSDRTQPLPPDTTREQLLARFHVRRSDGELLSGAQAFLALWAALAGPGRSPAGRGVGAGADLPAFPARPPGAAALGITAGANRR
jgi:hypothetical protein